MPSKIWDKYKRIKEIESNNTYKKNYLARTEIIVQEIIPKNKDDYYTIIERLENIKKEEEINIYNIIEENERIYVIIDNNKELISEIDKLILSDKLDTKKEGIIEGHGIPITKEEIFDLFKMEKSMCKISFVNDKGEIDKVSGFFCEIDNFPIKHALFTNNYVLNESNNEIGKIIHLECLELQKSISNSSYIKLKKEIKISERRKVFTNKELDYTCIELFESDGFIDYFKVEPNSFKNDKNEFKDNDIFILQFPDGNDLSFSYGKIQSLIGNKLIYISSTGYGSSGSPIIRRRKTNCVMGLHRGAIKKNNLATSFDSILDDIKEKNNIINCIYIPDIDVTKINLLYDYNEDVKDWDKEDKKVYLEAKNNISEENVDLYVNDKKIQFDYKYEIKDSNEIKVKFKFKKLLNNISYMFYECKSLKSIDLSLFNTTNVNNMSGMFSGCSSLKSIDLSSFNTTNVNNMSDMFSYCSSLQSIDLSSFNINNVNNIENMFYECKSLQSIDLSSFNTSNVNNMSYMFSGCSSLKSIDLSSFNITNVNNMSGMFSGCSSLKSIDLSSFNTTNVNNMSGMFSGCSSLKSIDLSSFNTTNVNNMSYMFSYCSSLIPIDLSSFNTASVNNMSYMFSFCSSLKSIDLSLFNTTNVNNMNNMFSGCSSLKKKNIKIKNKNEKLLKLIEENLK